MTETEAVAVESSVQQPVRQYPMRLVVPDESVRKEIDRLGLGGTCGAQGGICEHLCGFVRNGTVALVSCALSPTPLLIKRAQECDSALPSPII